MSFKEDNTDNTGDNADQNVDLGVAEGGIDDKDQFINTLQDEARSLKEQVGKSNTDLEEMKETIKKLNEALLDRQDNSDKTKSDSTLTFDQIDEHLERQATKRAERSNLDSVKDAVGKQFGITGISDIESKLNELCSKEGINLDLAVLNAKQAPEMLLKSIGVTGLNSNKDVIPTKQGFNQNAFNQNDNVQNKLDSATLRSTGKLIENMEARFKAKINK